MSEKLFLFGIAALIISSITQYLITDLAHRKGIFMDDNESDLPQKLHKVPTPRIGGLGIFLGLACIIADAEIGRFLLISLIPAFISGFLEDLYANISPKKRLLIMSFSAIFAIYLLKAYVTDYGIFEVPTTIGILISVIAITGMVNGTNLLDGFNGLSSGISLIILACFAITAYKVGDDRILMVSTIAFCAILGFYFFNFPKGKIFLGDGGAYSIGFLLAVIGILIVKNNPGKVDPFFALLSLIYPVWEVIFSFSRRIIAGKSPLHPDSLHVHQLFFNTLSKENNPRTSLFVYPIVVFFCGIAAFFCDSSKVLAPAALLFIFLYTATYFFLKKQLTRNK